MNCGAALLRRKPHETRGRSKKVLRVHSLVSALLEVLAKEARVDHA